MATTNLLPQIAWDSCTILDFLDQKSKRHSYILPVAKEAFDKKLVIVVSALAVSEVLHLESKPKNEIKIIADFFDSPFVRREAVGLFICEAAREIRRKYPLGTADAIHLATALTTETPTLLTTDGDGQKQPKKRSLILLDGKLKLSDGRPLRVMTAKQYDEHQRTVQTPLFAKKEE